MDLQLAAHAVAHMIEVNSDTFSPGKLECRNEITITRDYNDYVNKRPKRKPRNIQTNSEINAFLFDIWNEIACVGLTSFLRHTLKRLCTKFPAVNNSIPQSKSEIGTKL